MPMEMQLLRKGVIFAVSGCLWGGVVAAEHLKIVCPGKEIALRVEVPQTPEERRKGLMFRETLDEDAGMLFLFPDAAKRSPAMWMKNTVLPLDMIFADQEGHVLKVFENTTPYSLESIGPVEGTVQVLEVKAGVAQKHGITRACQIQRAPE